jgi:hypothetical protein
MNEPLAVVLQLRAVEEVEEIDAWWRRNRTASPDLFLRELDARCSALPPSCRRSARPSEAIGLWACDACSFAGPSITSTTESATRSVNTMRIPAIVSTQIRPS